MGLGSLNKISVPVANQCYRLLHLLSATRTSERTKKQERGEKAASSGGSDTDPQPEDGAQARGRSARGLRV
jgi:hypothetical protein